jgi:hypothetical protein
MTPLASVRRVKSRPVVQKAAGRGPHVAQFSAEIFDTSNLASYVNLASCYLFREWAEWPIEDPWARSGAASMARFARTRRRSSTYRGTSTTTDSPFASKKSTRATLGSSLEIRVSADLASKM